MRPQPVSNPATAKSQHSASYTQGSSVVGCTYRVVQLNFIFDQSSFSAWNAKVQEGGASLLVILSVVGSVAGNTRCWYTCDSRFVEIVRSAVPTFPKYNVQIDR
jgi:hypothetical protein